MAKSMAALSSLLLILMGLACSSGGDGSSGALDRIPPSITAQPDGQSGNPGDSTVFTVRAEGTPPLTYQWYWNGILVPGATGATFATPPAVSSDNQSVLSVSVSNAFGTVLSRPATLAVAGSPRSPQLGDLRFKEVDAIPLGLQGYMYTNLLAGSTATFRDLLGWPLELSGSQGSVPMNATWSFEVLRLPAGAPSRTTIYQSDSLQNFQSCLGSRSGSDTVIRSMDIQAGPACFAWELAQAPSNWRYSFGSQALLPQDFPAAAIQEGAKSRVITAVSWQEGKVIFISYGWQGDPSTQYEASTIYASADSVESSAVLLAKEGYIITALGGNSANGFILVGTRVKGDSLPRPFQVWDPQGSATLDRGYSCVGHIFRAGATTSLPSRDLWFMER